MGFLLHLLSYGVGLTTAVFVILSLANGLLWIAELIEEHSKTSKTIGVRLIYGIILLHIALFLTEKLPFHLVLFSVACHVIYLQNFSATWPFFSLTSPAFILSCIAVVTDHFLWFSHFTRESQKAQQWQRGRYASKVPSNIALYGFWETTSFFGTCVWLIPVFLFLSLSSNDNTLPFSVPARENVSSPRTTRAPRTSLFKRLFKLLPDALIPKYLKSKDTVLPILSPSVTLSHDRPDFFLQEPPTRVSQSNSPSRDTVPVSSTPEQRPLPAARRRSARVAPDPIGKVGRP